MKNLTLFFLLSLLTTNGIDAQSCFNRIWDGNGLDQMNIYLVLATYNDINLSVGDEIGIFDGEDCVGIGTLTQELTGGNVYLEIKASTDDPGSPEKDGFTVGNPIGFRICSGGEIFDVVINPIYTDGEGIFSYSGTAVVELRAEDKNRSPQVVSQLPDLTVIEGSGTIFEEDISYVFSDPDGDPLTYSASSSNEEVVSVIINGSVLSIIEEGIGTSSILLYASDGELFATDTFLISVEAIECPAIINPVPDQLLEEGFATLELELSSVFSEPSGKEMFISVTSDCEGIVSYSHSDSTLTLIEAGPGVCTISICSDNGACVVCDEFKVTIGSSSCSLPPTWKVNPYDFGNNGQITTQVILNDTPVESGYLGAFVNGECRGVASIIFFPPTGEYIFTIMCYSNASSGESLELRYLDDATCIIYEALSPTYEFLPDMVIGSAMNPEQVKVCPLPGNWNIIPSDYAFNGQITASVILDDLAVEGGYLGAFVGDECRGYTRGSLFPQTGEYVFELGCYSNVASGEYLEFRYYDMITCSLVEPICPMVHFESDMIIGSSSDPFRVSTCIDYSRTFEIGWNWFSVNALDDDMSLGNLLSCVAENDYIKSQVESATYYEGYGWYGSLEELDPRAFYKIKAVNPCGAGYMGLPVDVLSIRISIQSGWNWIGYLPREAMAIGDALGSMVLEENDYIKNQTHSSTYYDGFGWYGSLDTLNPTDGFMLRKNSADELNYPVGASLPEISTKSASIEDIQGSTFDPYQFEYSGSVTAQVIVGGSLSGSEHDLVLAYVDGQLRGAVSGKYFDPVEAYAFTLMIHSNEERGELITFRYYNAETGQLYGCDESLVFYEDMVEASAFESFELHVNSSLGMENANDTKNLSLDVYPNPFRGLLQIDYSIAERSMVRVAVYDLLGKLVEMVDEHVLDPGNYSTTWAAEACPGSIYILKISTEDEFIMKRIILK